MGLSRGQGRGGSPLAPPPPPALLQPHFHPPLPPPRNRPPSATGPFQSTWHVPHVLHSVLKKTPRVRGTAGQASLAPLPAPESTAPTKGSVVPAGLPRGGAPAAPPQPRGAPPPHRTVTASWSLAPARGWSPSGATAPVILRQCSPAPHPGWPWRLLKEGMNCTHERFFSGFRKTT